MGANQLHGSSEGPTSFGFAAFFVTLLFSVVQVCAPAFVFLFTWLPRGRICPFPGVLSWKPSQLLETVLLC